MKKIIILNSRVIAIFFGVLVLIFALNYLQKFFDLNWMFDFIEEKSKPYLGKVGWTMLGVFVLCPFVIAWAKKSRKEESKILKWMRKGYKGMAKVSAYALSGMGGALVGYGLSNKLKIDEFHEHYIANGLFALVMALVIYSIAFKFSDDLRQEVLKSTDQDKIVFKALATAFSVGMLCIGLFHMYHGKL
jgi:hypothetical protein